MSITLFQNKRKLKLNIQLFSIIFLTTSFVVNYDVFSSFITIALWLVLLASLIHSSINLKTLSIFLLSLLLLWVSVLVNDTDYLRIAKFSVALLCGFLFSTKYNIEEIKNSIVDVVKFIAIISLFGFVFFTLLSNFQFLLPVFVRNSLNFRCAYIYIAIEGLKRNCGLFWEPGVFQTFLNIALLLEVLKKKTNIVTAVIFIITIVTTFSTTGYIAMLMIVLLPFLLKGKDKRGIKKVFFVFLMIAAIFVLFNYDYIFSSDSNSVFGKITAFFHQGENITGRSSANARYYSITLGMQAFFEKPIFGWSYTGLLERISIVPQASMTCTFINWFSMYGVIYGAIMVIGSYFFFRTKSTFISIFAFAIFLICIISEEYSGNVFFSIVAFSGLCSAFSNKSKTVSVYNGGATKCLKTTF